MSSIAEASFDKVRYLHDDGDRKGPSWAATLLNEDEG